MLVILVVAIAGIWVGACIWRRRYLKKRERLAAWGRKGASAPGATESQAATGAPIESSPQTDDPRAAGSFMPNSHSAAPEEKRSRRLFGRR